MSVTHKILQDTSQPPRAERAPDEKPALTLAALTYVRMIQDHTHRLEEILSELADQVKEGK